MSRKLATAVAGVTALLWIVALRYGNFSRKAQRTYQDALAETNQVRVAKLNEQYLGAGLPQHSLQVSGHIGWLSMWCISHVLPRLQLRRQQLRYAACFVCVIAISL